MLSLLENKQDRDVPWKLLNYGKCEAMIFFARRKFQMFGTTIDFPVNSPKPSLINSPTEHCPQIEHFGRNPVESALTGVLCDVV